LSLLADGFDKPEVSFEARRIETDVELVKVEDDQDAIRFKFPGSPSFRVNGMELWPEEREAYVLSCRVYPSQEGIIGWPTVHLLRQKLHEAKERG
jgi:hypothetical protein